MSKKIILLKEKTILSSNSGILILPNIKGIKLIEFRINQGSKYKGNQRLLQSRFLFLILKNISFNSDWITKYESPVYFRRVRAIRDVLDIAGSLSDGGRLNIGGSQTSSSVRQEFSPIGDKRAALYLGEDLDIIKKEYSDCVITNKSVLDYQIKFRNRKFINLIDIEKVFKSLEVLIPNFETFTQGRSINSLWGDYKFPLPTQILGHWLMDNAGKRVDGIRFPSIYDNTKYNVCLYFNDTKDSKKNLKATLMQ